MSQFVCVLISWRSHDVFHRQLTASRLSRCKHVMTVFPACVSTPQIYVWWTLWLLLRLLFMFMSYCVNINKMCVCVLARDASGRIPGFYWWCIIDTLLSIIHLLLSLQAELRLKIFCIFELPATVSQHIKHDEAAHCPGGSGAFHRIQWLLHTRTPPLICSWPLAR